MARAYLRTRMAKARALAMLAIVVVACATVTSPLPTPTDLLTLPPAATPSPSPPPPPLVRARSVNRVGGAIVASGQFAGSRATQVAVIRDPSDDLTLEIVVRASAVDDASAGTPWFRSEPQFFSLARAKFAVADVDGDGKDDLVALYDAGSLTSRIYVFKSSGTAFTFAGAWWTGEEYPWSRARNFLGARVGGSKDALFVTYQDDGARMRIHEFASDGAKLAPPVTVYDSGKGQFDLGKARFVAGKFTRTAGDDQLAALYQTGSKARVLVFDPTPMGFTLLPDPYETDVDLPLAQTAVAAVDVDADGRDDLVLEVLDAEGGSKIQVLDAAASFRPANGWSGWASLPPATSCPYAGALAAGDWDGDGHGDALVLAPAANGPRLALLHGNGASFSAATPAPAELRCPTWPLNGLPLANGDPAKRPIYVKIDNNPTARPHFGISKADQVYEWLVEGLTTRLAAVFQSQQPDVIGAVRSARMTDRPVIPSLGAIFVYSGGGPEELMALNYDAAVAHRYIDLGPGYAWGYRVDSRPAPYNYFTSYRNVMAAASRADESDQPVIVASWRFLPSATGDPQSGGFVDSTVATTVSIPYRGGFGVRYQYDGTSRTYARFDDGVREVDAANNVAIAARNVVVIQTEVHFTTEFGLDPAGNPKLDEKLTGSGKAIVFRDGRREDVTWTRGDIVDAFTVRNASGEIVLLSPGQTWIHVVPQDWTIPSS